MSNNEYFILEVFGSTAAEEVETMVGDVSAVSRSALMLPNRAKRVTNATSAFATFRVAAGQHHGSASAFSD
jgi:hypothetical protein